MCEHTAHFLGFVQRQSTGILALMVVFSCLSATLGGLNPTGKRFSLIVRRLRAFKFSRKFWGLLRVKSEKGGSKVSNFLENLEEKWHLFGRRPCLGIDFSPPSLPKPQCDTLVSPVSPSKTGCTPSVYRHCVTVTPSKALFLYSSESAYADLLPVVTMERLVGGDVIVGYMA